MNLQETIKQFEKQTDYTLEVKDGHLYYGGSLNLRNTGITSLPDNLTVNIGKISFDRLSNLFNLHELTCLIECYNYNN